MNDFQDQNGTSSSGESSQGQSEPGGQYAVTLAIDYSQETPGDEFGATLDHPSGSGSFSARSPGVHGTKQCRDLAFAAAIMHLGFLNSRTLGQATKTWTTHGGTSLAAHLVASGLISAEQRRRAESRAEQRMSAVCSSQAKGGSSGDGSSDLSQTSREQHWLAQLDPSGKVAKLLGIADTSVLSRDEIQDRSVGSRYTLLRKLGQGGLGVVWLARDQNLQRYVAVKEISRNVPPGDPSLEHFRREAEITGRLEHPGIVPVYQYGDDEATGKAFYVMRFLGKRTLQDAITEYHERREAGSHDPMLLHRLLTSLVSIFNSVSHAHSRNVIHRDLKPENIALNEFGQVTLLDWGLAKINDATGMYDVGGRSEPGDLHSVGSSQIGRVLGTPLYMSPEQAAGRLDEVDELSDVYALGGILYTILTGQAPHQSLIEVEESTGTHSDLLSRIVSGTIIPPHEILPSVPPELSAVCMKALAKKRYLRYETAADLSDDVQRYMAGATVTAYAPPFKQRVRRWMANHPTLTQSILLAGSLLMIGAAMIGYTARQGRLALQQARYNSVKEFSRELEVNLGFETRGLERNLHFMSELPLMEAVVYSQRRLEESDAAASATDTESSKPEAAASSVAQRDAEPASGNTSGNDSPDNDSPDSESQGSAPTTTSISATAPASIFGNLDEATVKALHEISPSEWRDRLGNMVDGLLNANPSYLVAATFEKHDDGSCDELIRSERASHGSRVRRIPAAQLVHCLSKAADAAEGTMRLSELRPDEVALITNDQLSPEIPVKTRSPLVLSGLRPIFDAEGRFFGANVIALDLTRRLAELCNAVAPEHVSVCITDVDGNIVLRYHDGRVAHKFAGQSIFQEFPDLKTFFADDATMDEQGDQETYFAKRVYLGGVQSKAQIVIVSHILENE